MSKRRNKNKKAGPVKIIRPAEMTAPTAEDAFAAPAVEQAEDMSAMLTAPDIVDDDQTQQANEDHVPAEMEHAQAEHAEAEHAEAEHAEAEHAEAEHAEAEHVELEHASTNIQFELSEETTPSGPPSDEPAEQSEPLREFDDASALLAEAIPVDPTDVRRRREFESIPIVDPSAAAFEAGEAERSEVESAPPAPVESVEDSPVGEDRKSRKQDRKLKLNKLQKHARSAPEPEPEPEVVAPEPETTWRAPSEPRIAAFAKLTEYQSMSLAHVVGVPEEADVAGHWRGVGFGISGRRLVAAFDEVVEIIRVPQVTHVPGTQPWMLGVANVRGTLLPVVDLKQFLEGERTVMHEGQRVLVVRQTGGNVAVLIDQLFGQRTFNDMQKVASEVDSSTRYGHFIKQVYRVGDYDWGVFSMSMLTRTPEFRQAAA